MKFYLLLVLLLAAGLCAQQLTPSQLTVEDLAAERGMRHHSFEIQYPQTPEAISYELVLYQEGKVDRVLDGNRFALNQSTQNPDRVVVMMGESVDGETPVTLRCQGYTSRAKIRFKMDEVMNHWTGDPKLDGQSRLVLAFAPHAPHERGKAISAENSTPEGAYCALVLQITPEYPKEES